MKKTLLAGAFAFFLSACGGGGGSSSSTPAVMEITEGNADAVLAATVASTEVTDFGNIGIPVPAAKTALKVAKSVSVDDPSYLVVGDPNGICLFGGTSSIDGTTVTLTECIVDEFGTTLNGQIRVLSETSVQFIDLSIAMGELLAYFTSGTFTFNDLTGEMSGTITGYMMDGIYRIDYDSFTMAEINDNYSFNGFIKTDCIGGWVEIKTVQPLVGSESCPTQGEIAIIGDGSELNMLFAVNPSVTVTLNGEPYGVYTTCEDLPSIDDTCIIMPI